MPTDPRFTGANPARAAMVGVSDFDGVLRGKHVLGEDLSDGDKVIKFSEAVLAWDCTYRVIPASFTQKPLSAFGDADLRILSGTGRSVSHLGSQYLYLAEFTGAHENICPRAAFCVRSYEGLLTTDTTALPGLSLSLYYLRRTQTRLKKSRSVNGLL
ncbi:hypothetical protein ABH976_005626 [Bradyrhizobium ottawaense]